MHKVMETLVALGLSAEDSFQPYYPATRDNPDVKVLQCSHSGVFVLDSVDHMSESYYRKAKLGEVYSLDDSRLALSRGAWDNQRRLNKYLHTVMGKKYLDFGAGVGGMLQAFEPYAAECFGVEIQADACAMLRGSFKVLPDIEAFGRNDFEVVSLFHVAEHLTDPLATLSNIHTCMKPGGTIIVEVPHAKDALLSLYGSEAFKKFTFWSQHILLHTRQSLQKLVEAAGFHNIAIEGVQRYPLSNHLYWLTHQKPGGHAAWPLFNQPALLTAYEQALQAGDITDTLVLTATR